MHLYLYAVWIQKGLLNGSGKKMIVVYGNEASSAWTCQKWFGHFRSGNVSLEISILSERPYSVGRRDSLWLSHLKSFGRRKSSQHFRYLKSFGGHEILWLFIYLKSFERKDDRESLLLLRHLKSLDGRGNRCVCFVTWKDSKMGSTGFFVI